MKGCKEEGEFYTKGNGGIDRQLDQLKVIGIEVVVGLAGSVSNMVDGLAGALPDGMTLRDAVLQPVLAIPDIILRDGELGVPSIIDDTFGMIQCPVLSWG